MNWERELRTGQICESAGVKQRCFAKHNVSAKLGIAEPPMASMQVVIRLPRQK